MLSLAARNPGSHDLLALWRIGRMQLLDVRSDETLRRVGGGEMRRLQGTEYSCAVTPSEVCRRIGRHRTMARVCNREGCGRRIVAKDGSPDYRKHFCGPACLKIDKRERLQAKRVRLGNQRCPIVGENRCSLFLRC